MLGQVIKRFTLPQICDCGARGAITFEPGRASARGQPEGAFGLVQGGGIICLSCGDRLGWRSL
jgi:hypothetical protein